MDITASPLRFGKPHQAETLHMSGPARLRTGLSKSSGWVDCHCFMA